MSQLELFDIPKHEVVKSIVFGTDTKYLLRRSDGYEFWTNELGLSDFVKEKVSMSNPQ